MKPRNALVFLGFFKVIIVVICCSRKTECPPSGITYNTTICEGDYINLSHCAGSHYALITSVFYGRKECNICGCKSNCGACDINCGINITQQLQYVALYYPVSGISSNFVLDYNLAGVDPCYGTSKYAIISYQCIGTC